MRDDRDYKLDLSTQSRDAARTDASTSQRPFISVHFSCCNVYCRIYRNLDGLRYDGRCPRCARTVSFIVGADGTSQRFFVAS